MDLTLYSKSAEQASPIYLQLNQTPALSGAGLIQI